MPFCLQERGGLQLICIFGGPIATAAISIGEPLGTIHQENNRVFSIVNRGIDKEGIEILVCKP